jgi:hypothetical protein
MAGFIVTALRTSNPANIFKFQHGFEDGKVRDWSFHCRESLNCDLLASDV